MFREICQLIEARTGFAIGSTLQVGHRAQNAPDRHILVQETGGEPNENRGCSDMVNLRLMVVSRALTYFNAHDDAWDVYWALHGTAGWNLPPASGTGPHYLAMTVTALASPQYLGVGDNRQHEFSLNLIFRMEEGSCSSPLP